MHVHYTCSFSSSGGVLRVPFTLLLFSFLLSFQSSLLLFFVIRGYYPPTLISRIRERLEWIILIIPVQCLGLFWVGAFISGVSKRFRVWRRAFLNYFLPIQLFPTGILNIYLLDLADFCYTISISAPCSE